MSFSARHISKSYGDKIILNDLNFTISSGEIVGLLGKNGVGKTTLLKIIAGITQNYDGAIELEGIARSQARDYKRLVGYMSEKNPLYPELYVKEYLKWIAQTHDKNSSDQRIDEVILETGLQDMRFRKIKELSKGYRQRLGIAAAMIHAPKMLILDEPINGLDPAQILQYRALIKRLSPHMIVILSSHLMQEIEALCTRIIMIEDGKILKDELLHGYRNQSYQKIVIEFAHKMDLSVLQSQVIDCVAINPCKYILTYDPFNDPRKELMKMVWEQGTYIVQLNEHRGELDQLFKS